MKRRPGCCVPLPRTDPDQGSHAAGDAPQAARHAKADAPLELPESRDRAGETRRVGVELEFGGLEDEEAARIVADVLGGRPERADKGWTVEGSSLGRIEVYLDTRFRLDAESVVRDLARLVVPVEIVTGPIEPARLAEFDALLAPLRDAGALGTDEGLFLGFGLHLNPSVTGLSLDDILPVLRAYALVEAFLADLVRQDISRRLLPFSSLYPDDYVDALAAAEFGAIDGVIEQYLVHNATRNRGLDMLPLFAEIDAERVRVALGEATRAVVPRPAWHYRLPDARIDDPDWSVSREWNRWVWLERLATREPAVVDELAGRWAERRGGLPVGGPDWAEVVRDVLTERGALPDTRR